MIYEITEAQKQKHYLNLYYKQDKEEKHVKQYLVHTDVFPPIFDV